MGDGWDDIFLLELHVLCDYAVLLYYFSKDCRFQEAVFRRAGNAFLRSRPAVYHRIRDISKFAGVYAAAYALGGRRRILYRYDSFYGGPGISALRKNSAVWIRVSKRDGFYSVESGGCGMAIILRLDRVMADRKMSLNELSKEVGISNVNLSNLKTGKVKAIRFSNLESICDVLDCQPGDILEYRRET